MKAEQLWASILQEAIQGKLVPQLESEPDVIQIGKVPEDVPFHIPEKWAWIQLGELINYGSSKQIEGSQITPSTWVLDLEDIEKNSGKLLQKKYGTKTTSNKSCFRKGDVLYGKLRPYLNKVLIADEDGCCSTEIVPISVSSAKLKIDAEFLSYFLRSPYFVEYANGCAYGVKMPRLGTKDAKSAWVAIPPLAEQHRIVVRLQKVRSLVDTYRREEIQFAQLITEFPDKLKASILQEAIQGKLVPQLESEPVVNQIGDVPDNCPFRLPKKWKWVKLGAAFSLNAGKFISASEIKDSGAYPCYGGNGKRGYVDKFNREGRFPLIGRQGALCGNINLVDGKFYATEHAVVADGGNIIDPDCAAFFLKALNLNQYATKTAQPGLSVKRISKTPFPLAPIQEQKRIVKKIQDLLLEISSIKQS